MVDTILTYIGAFVMMLGIVVVIVCFVMDGVNKIKGAFAPCKR